MQTATADPLVSRLLEGRYRIIDRIARGGMSTVYSAVDERLDRLVAVKVMSSVLSSDPAFSDRFAREARAAARLTHVNAVAVYDQGHDSSADGGHHVFLVMELVKGRTLRDLMRERSGRFTPAEAVSIMEPVLGALAAAHRAGLVHRDVKPENILLSDAGVVKVADFGLARAVDADVTSTRTGLMMGTVAYCSPEQIARGEADPRSDVYSAGIVLFELLTGRPPYQGESAINVAYQHVHSRVPAPSTRARGIPREIDELVVSATDTEPTGRPADAAAFLAEIADLRELLGLPITPIPARRRDTPPADLRRTQRATPDAASTDVLGSAAAWHDTSVVPRRVTRSDDGMPPPPVVIPPPKPRKQRSPRARRRRRALIITVVVLLLGALSLAGGYVGTHYWQAWNSHVPNLANRSLTTAEDELVHDHYKLGRISNQFSDTVKKGTVISTDPSSGTRLQQGKAIDLTVSLGRDLVTVPDVSRQTLDHAKSTLQSRGLQFSATPKFTPSVSVPSGNVVSTEPRIGVNVPRTQVVTIVVSSGPPIRNIPAIPQGTPYDQAKTLLEKAKFKVTKDVLYSNDVSTGGVISVSPSGQAPQGTPITVSVSKGPEFVIMPTIAPLSSFADATAQLEQLGLNVARSVVYGKGKRDLVVGQSPDPGTSVHVGTTVTLAVI